MWNLQSIREGLTGLNCAGNMAVERDASLILFRRIREYTDLKIRVFCGRDLEIFLHSYERSRWRKRSSLPEMGADAIVTGV